MSIHQWEVWKARPLGFQSDHWFVVISGQERCDSPQVHQVNALACFTLRGKPFTTDVLLAEADGFSMPTCCQCDFILPLDKSKLHSSRGLISWERQQQLKSKLKEVLRL
jgi:hypothetical protein